jgi:hypothetical protein
MPKRDRQWKIPAAAGATRRASPPRIYLLPNLFTTAALFAGFYAVVQG